MRALDHPLRVSRQARAATAARQDGAETAAGAVRCTHPSAAALGIFYVGGGKANALFFDRRPPEAGAITRGCLVGDQADRVVVAVR
jgi:hypothetical protein